MAKAMATLVCGIPSSNQELGRLLHHMSSVLDTFEDQLAWLSSQPDSQVTLYGPLVGRAILEVAFQSFLARLDPFRVLILRQIQQQPAYSIGKKVDAAIRWQGDVMAKSGPPPQLWSSENSQQKFTRAVLGDYVEHLFWQPAFADLIAAPEDGSGGPWMAELRATETAKLIPIIRGHSSRLFSSLSKGIHHEFLIPLSAQYDRVTVVDLIRDSIKYTSMLALISHSLDHCPFSLPRQQAIQLFEAAQNLQVQ